MNPLFRPSLIDRRPVFDSQRFFVLILVYLAVWVYVYIRYWWNNDWRGLSK